MQSLPRPLAFLLSSSLSSSSSSSGLFLTCASRQRPIVDPTRIARFANAQRRHASTMDQKQVELQEKQARLADKMGRMRQQIGHMVSVPIFANHIPPQHGREFAPDTSFSVKRRYWIEDQKNLVQNFLARRKMKKVLGSGWLDHFNDRSLIAYKLANQALASGHYEPLRNLTTPSVIDSIKAMRVRSFPAQLGLSWKLHDLSSQTIVCARHMELQKPGEPYAQIAMRFVTLQSLEIRDSSGKLVASGSHDSPQEVTEYCIFQREMWHPNDDWKLVKKGARETDLIANPADQA